MITNRIIKSTILGNLRTRYRSSLPQGLEFWKKAADDITWIKPYSQILDDSKSPFNKLVILIHCCIT